MYINKLNPDKIKSLYWQNKYNVGEIANKLNISIWSLYNFMNKHKINRRDHSNERLRIYLYAYSCHNINTLKAYWHKVTQVSLRQFTKPYIRKGNLNLSNRKMPYGLVHVRYNDKRLLNLIKDWIDEYVIWAGTQVAKGGRLCKSSVLPKGEMEK